jgi:hypothetical protein
MYAGVCFLQPFFGNGEVSIYSHANKNFYGWGAGSPISTLDKSGN